MPEKFKGEMPPQEHKKESKISPEQRGKKRSTIWRKVEKAAKIAALAALFYLPGIESGLFAQEKGEKVDAKTKIEQLTEKAANHIEKIVDIMKEKGQSGKIGETPVRRWVSPDQKNLTIVGYSEDGEKARWLIHECKEASVRFFDRGADGSVDRLIINKGESRLGRRGKSADNDLMTFPSIVELAENAEIEASLEPQDIKVYEISFENGQFIIRCVDYQTGEAGELTGPDAEKLVSGIQEGFTDRIESVEDEIGK